jgi:hypothetical protein
VGFSGWEFNCAHLAKHWIGLLVDGDAYNVTNTKALFKKNITVERRWLTLDNLDLCANWLDGRTLGILSLDVDGNDYWFLENLISLNPCLIVAEYNSSLGLRPLTVVYDPAFDRTTKHPGKTYFGASLTALDHLARKHNYSLIKVSPD